mmetsp:Transcript_15016/g.49828  ORF Transcript_15016/g.49828 Transcript_15016/m.49828 type:complete len:298 (-) Transcript_15016:906-1799(-)
MLPSSGIADCCTPSSSGNARIASITAVACTPSASIRRASCESARGTPPSPVERCISSVNVWTTSCGHARPNSRRPWSNRSVSAPVMPAGVGSDCPHVCRWPPRRHAAFWCARQQYCVTPQLAHVSHTDLPLGGGKPHSEQQRSSRLKSGWHSGSPPLRSTTVSSDTSRSSPCTGCSLGGQGWRLEAGRHTKRSLPPSSFTTSVSMPLISDTLPKLPFSSSDPMIRTRWPLSACASMYVRVHSIPSSGVPNTRGSRSGATAAVLTSTQLYIGAPPAAAASRIIGASSPDRCILRSRKI